MVYRALQRCIALAAAAIPLSGLCQAQPDPLDPRAPVPAIRYHSSFSDSPVLEAAPVGSWRDANENVNRIGGWRTYAREAQVPTQPTVPARPSQPAAGATESSPGPKGTNHSGH